MTQPWLIPVLLVASVTTGACRHDEAAEGDTGTAETTQAVPAETAPATPVPEAAFRETEPREPTADAAIEESARAIEGLAGEIAADAERSQAEARDFVSQLAREAREGAATGGDVPDRMADVTEAEGSLGTAAAEAEAGMVEDGPPAATGSGATEAPETDVATGAARAEIQAEDEPRPPLGELLTPGGFDRGHVVGAIADSHLPALDKTILTQAVYGVETSGEDLRDVIDRVRIAFGMEPLPPA